MNKVMRLVARLSLVAVALGAALPCGAEEPAAGQAETAPSFYDGWNLDVKLSDDGSTIYIVGDLLDGAYFRVVDLLRESPRVTTLWLGSSGGLTREGLLIGDLVKKYRLDTYVGHFCGSACTQIFVAGKERILGPDAQLGFHESYEVTEDGDLITEKMQGAIVPENFARRSIFDPRLGTMIRLSYERAGLPAEFVERVFAVPPDEMWRPAREDLGAAGIFTKAVSGADEIASPAGMVRRTDIEQEVGGQPLWRQMQAADPETFAAAVDEVWMDVNAGGDPALAKLVARDILIEKAMPLVGYTPDEILDRYILLLGEIAAYQRRLGYPYCAREAGQAAEPMTEQETLFLQREDMVLDEVIAASGKRERKSMKNAEKEFFKLYGHSVKSGSIEATALQEEQKRCEVTQRLFEDNVTRKPKDRIKAFRALMQLGEQKTAA